MLWKMKLDTVDLEIMRILQENARIPLSQIAKKVKISRPTVSSRIEKLKKEGIIKGFTVIIDRDALMENIIVFFNLKAKNATKVSKILSQKSNVLELYTTLGGKNIICKAYAKNLEDLKSLMSEIEKIKEIEKQESFIGLKKLKQEHEAKLGPEIGVLMECDSCEKSISSDEALIYKPHNQEYFFCCRNCLKKFKKQRKILRERKKKI